MESMIRRIGLIVLVVGVLMLASGLICAITVGTIAVPILLSASIVVNTVAIMLLRYKR